MIQNRSVPAASVIPVLPYPDVSQAADWLCEAFGFKVRLRIASHRAQLVFGNGAVIVRELRADETPAGVAPQFVHVRIEDADRHHERAMSSGARILDPPTDYRYGERQYTADDLGGHRWTFSQSIADLHPAEWGGTAVELE